MPDAPVILRPDGAGGIVRLASLGAIQQDWKPPLEAVVADVLERYGGTLHSVYLRGSVALGRARAGLSDIDCLVLVSDPPDIRTIRARQADLSARVAIRWPFVAEVEAPVFSLRKLQRERWLQALLASQCVCLYGGDVIPSLPVPRLGADMLFETWFLPQNLGVAESSPDDVDVQVWFARKLVRAGFELVMLDANFFTRDLVACAQAFCRFKPERAAEMSGALQLALGEATDPEAFRAVRGFAGNYLYPALCLEYGAERVADLVSRGLYPPTPTPSHDPCQANADARPRPPR